MSIYGKPFGFKESSNVDCYDELFESTAISLSESFDILTESKLPQELKLDVPDIISASKFKSKTKKVLDFMQDDNWSEKKIAKTVYMWYFAIIGCTFNGTCKKYEPKMNYMVDLVNKYCNDKQRSRIKKDMEKTIDAIDKLEERNNNADKDKKRDITLNLDYRKDITAAVKKIK